MASLGSPTEEEGSEDSSSATKPSPPATPSTPLKKSGFQALEALLQGPTLDLIEKAKQEDEVKEKIKKGRKLKPPEEATTGAIQFNLLLFLSHEFF